MSDIPNVNVRDSVKQKLIDRLQDHMVAHPEFKDCVKDYFAVDYKLYESVKFYD